jgi:hypothetical protein
MNNIIYVTIYGQHTLPYGDFPYDKGYEFKQLLRNNWSAIDSFSFNSIDSAEIGLDANQMRNLTTEQVLIKLKKVVLKSAIESNWNIWTVYDLT